MNSARRRSRRCARRCRPRGIRAARIETAWTGRSGYVGDNRKEGDPATQPAGRDPPGARHLQVVGPSYRTRQMNTFTPVREDRLRVGRYSQRLRAGTNVWARRTRCRRSSRLIFPSQIRTVGAALNHLLARSGWALASTQPANPTIPYLMSLLLPRVATLGPIVLFDALAVLFAARPTWSVDPVNRLVS